MTRPVDPRVPPLLATATQPLLVALAASVAGGLLVVAQAFAVGSLVVAVVRSPTGSGWHVPAACLVALVLGRVVATAVVEAATAAAAARATTRLRRRVLSAYLDAGGATGATRRAGATALLATRGAAAVEPYVTRFLPAVATAAVLPVATLVAITWLDPLSGLVVGLTLPLVPAFAALVGMATADRAARQWRSLGDLSGHFLDVVRGLPTLVAHRRATAQSRTIRDVTDRYRRASLATLRLAFASSAVLELVATLSVALVAVTVGLRLAGGSLDFRTALVVLLLAPEAYWPLRRVGAEFHAAAEGGAALGQAADLIDAAPDPAAPRPGATTATRAPLVVADLTVGHDRLRGPVLTRLSASFGAEGLTVVTGPSGCGKSTLLAVLGGDLLPWSGSVTVGGVPLSDVDASLWRSRVAVAGQRPWLTPASIADNLRHGAPRARDVDLWEALAAVGLADTVASRPRGLDTLLGEDGAGLSAGQRARLSLARVVLAGRPYVLLDEPTAHLDEESRRVVLDVIAQLATRSCVIAVSHDPDVTARADHVLRLPSRVESRCSDAAGVAPLVAGRPAETPRAHLPAASSTPRQARFVPGLGTADVLGALSSASGVALTATAAWLITRAADHPPVLELMVAIVGVRLFGLARPVLRWAERLVSHNTALRELAERRARVYDRLVPLTPASLGMRRGALLASVVDDVDASVDRQLRVEQPRRTAAWVLLGVAGLVALVEWRAGLVVCLVAIGGVAGAALAGRTARVVEPTFVRHRARLGAAVESTVTSARPVVQWGAQEHFLDEVDHEASRIAAAQRRTAYATAAGRALALTAGGAGVVAMAYAIPAGAVSPAVAALLVLLPLPLADVTLPLVDAAILQARCLAAEARLQELSSTPPPVADPADPRPVTAAHPAVHLQGVTVGWPDAAPVLHDLDLALPAHGSLGIVGPSGCGKSTLAALLLRFLDPVAGRVRLDRDDLRDLALDDVRSMVGLVDDDPYVFGSTLLENVRLARPDARDDEVADALSRARLGEWVAGLPDGIHTRLGEGHADVSGGERARIGIARALLADQPVLVLDEPTAHLDVDTAAEVAAELLDVATGRTLVWITHGTVGLDGLDAVLSLGGPAQSSTRAPRDGVASIHRGAAAPLPVGR